MGRTHADTRLWRLASIGAVLLLTLGLALGPIGCGSDDPVQDAAEENAQEFDEDVEQQSGAAAENAEEAVGEMNEQVDQTEEAVEE